MSDKRLVTKIHKEVLTTQRKSRPALDTSSRPPRGLTSEWQARTGVCKDATNVESSYVTGRNGKRCHRTGKPCGSPSKGWTSHCRGAQQFHAWVCTRELKTPRGCQGLAWKGSGGWPVPGVGFLFGVTRMSWSPIVLMGAQLCEYTKTTELHT